MRPIVLALLLSVLGCSLQCGSGEETRCLFDGRYEIGGVPQTDCLPFSAQVWLYEEVPECGTSGQEVTDDGVRVTFWFTCEPGDPVGECVGSYIYSNGCVYDGYIRRISP